MDFDELRIIFAIIIGTVVALFDPVRGQGIIVRTVEGVAFGTLAWAVLPIIYDSVKQLFSMLFKYGSL